MQEADVAMTTNMKASCFHLRCIFALYLSVIGACEAFSPRTGQTGKSLRKLPQAYGGATTTLQLAKAKRRRRKESEENPRPDGSPDFNLSGSEDLPDFELKEEIKKVVKVNPDEISDAMMGSSTTPVKSIKELIADRSLEKSFIFDEPQDSLPDLSELAKETTSLGKKARKAARKAEAIQQKEEEEEDLISKIPMIRNENGEVSPIKVCASLLLLW